MKTLSSLTVALLLSAYCCTALASGADEANSEFIRQQESFSQQLRGQDNAPLRQILEQQGLPTSHIYSVAGKADTQPLFPDDPTLAANRRVTITLMREEPPVPPNLKP